jgi:hypothetical protein
MALKTIVVLICEVYSVMLWGHLCSKEGKAVQALCSRVLNHSCVHCVGVIFRDHMGSMIPGKQNWLTADYLCVHMCKVEAATHVTLEV